MFIVGVQTGSDQIKLLGTEAMSCRKGADSLLPCKSQLVYKVDVACCVNKFFKKLQNLKHWDCLLQGLTRQVERQSSNKTQEGSFLHWDTFMVSPCAVSQL